MSLKPLREFLSDRLMGLAEDLVVVVPVLNERLGVEATLKDLVAAGVPINSILVIDGGSFDGTADIARSMGARVLLQSGRGKADAIRTAISHIMSNGPGYKYVLVMDGDYTYPAEHIHDLYRRISEGYDLVIGARKHLEKGSQGFLYRLGNKILAWVFNTLFGTRLSDVLSGMYIARVEMFGELLFESRGFGIEAEIAAHVASTGGSIAEIPIRYRRRIDPRAKKLRIPHGFSIFWDIVRLSWRYSPVFLIFILGSLLLIPGLGLGAYVAYYYFFEGITYHVKGLAAIAITLAGFQSLLLALLSLYMKRMEIRITRSLRRISRRA